MGIDMLSITFRLEERFGTSFKGHFPGQAFQTAGTLCEFVWLKLQGIQPGMPDFEELRKRVTDALPDAPVRRGWFPGDEFEASLTNGDLQGNWQRFQQAIRLPLPQLEHDAGTNELRLPRGLRTTASAVIWIVQNHPDRVAWLRKPSPTERPPGADGITHEESWLRVRDVLADVLVVEPEQIVPEAHLIEELGME